MFYDRFVELCNKKGVSPSRAGLSIGVSKTSVMRWKNNGIVPKLNTLNKLADYFGVTTDYLLNGSDNKISSSKTEDDISSDLSKTLDKLYKQQDGIMFFDGEPIDDETKKLLTISLENTLRLAKEINKQKGKNKK